MNLNKYDREAFVRAVMDDVPSTDYATQMRDLGTKTVIASLPPEVKVVLEKHPDYLIRKGVRMPGRHKDLYVVGLGYNVIRDSYPEVWAKLVDLEVEDREQTARREALEAKLKAIIEGCRTLKQAKERLPEFEKYLPAERGVTGTTNLPAANLVAELNAAGWPKGE